MNVLRKSVLFASLTVVSAVPTVAEDAKWITRCSKEIGANNDPEKATMIFRTLGMEKGAQSQAAIDYSATSRGLATVYPTAAKDFMSQYSGATLGVGYVGLIDQDPPHAIKTEVGHVSIIASSREFKQLAGKITMKLVIDGKTFGPYEPKTTSISNGQYHVWLDTAQTDGDSAPPVLSPRKFAEIAKAVDKMKSAKVAIVQDGVEVAQMDIPLNSFGDFRGRLPQWASGTRWGMDGRIRICGIADWEVN